MSWHESAREHIQKLDDTLPVDLLFKDRQAAVRDAYPWGERKHHPYTCWLRAQREYLRRYQKSDNAIPNRHLSPLERLMKRAGA